VVDEADSVPRPDPMLQLTPELVGSFITESVKLCDPPTPRLIVAGLMGFRLMAPSISGTATDALLVVSVLLVAVTVAEVVVTGVGAV
jgi:hypothetical protein